MKRFILLAFLGVVGCGETQPTKPPPYQHTLTATAPEDRIKAIEERKNRYGKP